MTIIVMLSTLLFPVFFEAKQTAKRTACLSNLKQIAAAHLLYTTDYDDHCAPMQYALGVNKIQIWYGVLDVLDPLASDLSGGLLQPYLRNTQIIDCPSASDIELVSVLGWYAYGWNFNLFDSELDPDTFDLKLFAVSMSEVESPSETLFLGDTARPKADGRLSRDFSLACGTNFGFLHARHSDTAVVNWLDGHAKAHKIRYQTVDDPGFFPGDDYRTVELMQRLKLGNLYKYPKVTPNSYDATMRDCYYYLLDKPSS